MIPDFQGVGIGYRLTNFVAGYYRKKGKTMIINMSNPALIRSLDSDDNWIVKSIGRTSTRQGGHSTIPGMNKTFSGLKRLTVSFEYRPKKKTHERQENQAR